MRVRRPTTDRFAVRGMIDIRDADRVCVWCTANDYDPFKEARDERKARTAKNEKQRLANAARAQGTSAAAPNDEKKMQLNRQVAQTRASTASMGK